jgi:hypothetical protein
MYTATERLYITPDNKVVREHEMDESTVASLLVGEGGQLTDARAKELGLTDKAKAKAEDVKPEAEPKAAEPVADKAVKPAAVENKAAK